MKAVARGLLVAAVAAAAIAMSAAPSEAQKVITRAQGGLAYGSFYGELCSTGCNRQGVCKVMFWWGAQSKWLQSFITPTCTRPGSCPSACKPGNQDH
jgi:hypothetical protein